MPLASNRPRPIPDQTIPQGGWFVRWIDRPESPLRLKWFAIVGAVVGAVAIGCAWAWMQANWPKQSAANPGSTAFIALLAGIGTFSVVALVGIIAQALVRLTVYGPEWSMNREAIRHDFPLRRTWLGLFEVVLLAFQAVMMVWGLAAFIRQGSSLGLAVFVLVSALTFWPFVRYRLLTGRWPY